MMLQLIAVSKKYGDSVALDNINVSLAAGQIIGIIGPNGAGKTTLLRILATILGVSNGQVLYNGLDIQTNGVKYREMIGYMPEDAGLYLKLTPLQNIMFYRAFYGDVLPESTIQEFLQEYHLVDVLNLQTGKLSKGSKQKILFLRALLNNPQVLILDEPLNHLDPEIRVRVKRKLKLLSAAGKLVLLSSHTLFEVEDLCTAVVIIRQGRMVTAASLADLKDRYATAEEQSLESIYLRIITQK